MPNKYISFFLLIALCLPVAIACVDLMAVSVALNIIMREFSVSAAESQWLISAYTIGSASFLILVGKLADLYGRRKWLIIGVALFGAASLLAGFAPYMIVLIIARFLQGVASSIMMTTVVSIIIHHFIAEQRTHVLAKWVLSLGVGLALGPLVGALILHFTSWRFIFFINVPICLCAYYLITKYAPESRDTTNKIKISWGESLLLSITLILLVSILSASEDWGWRSLLMYELLVGFLLLMVSYAVLLRLKGSTLIDLSLFKLKNYFKGSFCGFLSYFCMYGWLFIFALYLQKYCGMSPIETGMMFVSYAITSAVCAQYMAKIIKSWGKKFPILIGFSVALIAFVWMSKINSFTPIWQLILMSALPGIMITFVNVASMNLAMSEVPSEKTGIASGIFFTIRWLGGSIGVAIITLLFENANYFKGLSNIKAACLGLAVFATLGLFLGASIKAPIKLMPRE